MLDYLLVLLAIVLTAALFGGMVFFAAVMAPLIHRKLPKETASGFLEDVFPVYYMAGALTAFVSAAAAIRPNPVAAGLLFLIGAGFLYTRVFILPRINEARAAGNEDSPTAFKALHRQSVAINLSQILLALATLLFLAIIGPLAALFNH